MADTDRLGHETNVVCNLEWEAILQWGETLMTAPAKRGQQVDPRLLCIHWKSAQDTAVMKSDASFRYPIEGDLLQVDREKLDDCFDGLFRSCILGRFCQRENRASIL